MSCKANAKCATPEANWTTVDYVLENAGIDQSWIAQNLVNLFEAENTIPFISRYRKEQTGSMDASKVREVFRCWEQSKQIRKRYEFVWNEVNKTGKMNRQLEALLKSAMSIEQLETLYAPFKAGNKKTLAERAKALGLEDPAMKTLSGILINLNSLVKPTVKGLASVAEVADGIKHILADHMLKQTETQKLLKKLTQDRKIQLESRFSKCKDSADLKKKYEIYSEFVSFVPNIKPHQVLAINRGESEKALAVKIFLPNRVEQDFKQFCTRMFLKSVSNENKGLAEKALKDCFDRLAQPQIARGVRSQLSKKAEQASVEVFATNLKQLLLAAPVKICPILGMDPGFKYGCKIAVVSLSNEVLDTSVVYLPTGKDPSKSEVNATELKKFVTKYGATKMAIGNGTGCREAESWISELIQRNYFKPLNIEYCIVSEQGASIYSVSELAAKELPEMDPNLRSAVSLARRVLDPLAELVKVGPKHLGVGMYQHDVNPKLLKETLDSVVEECVSFVGVDLNTSSQELLERVAGLNKARASKILELRKEKGYFTSRQQLTEVKGIGDKTFQQCAGFLRVYQRNTESYGGEGTEPNRKRRRTDSKQVLDKKIKKTRVSEWNPLDATSVHPESYSVAERILKLASCSVADVGKNISEALSHIGPSVEQIASDCAVGSTTVTDILRALQNPFQDDIRHEFEEPVFRQSVRSLLDLSVGKRLSGVVSNVTHFGSFVDIGVGCDGLIHVSKMRGRNLKVGERVDVYVLNVDLKMRRVGLGLI